MKLLPIMCASLLAISGLALTCDGANAAAKVKSHSNTNNNRLDANDPNAVKNCIAAGGTVRTNSASSYKTCAMPDSINYNASKSNTGNVTVPPKNTDSSSPK